MEIDADETYDWQCNRCNHIREQGVGRCPNCGCPEFRTVLCKTPASKPRPDQLMLPGM